MLLRADGHVQLTDMGLAAPLDMAWEWVDDGDEEDDDSSNINNSNGNTPPHSRVITPPNSNPPSRGASRDYAHGDSDVGESISR